MKARTAHNPMPCYGATITGLILILALTASWTGNAQTRTPAPDAPAGGSAASTVQTAATPVPSPIIDIRQGQTNGPSLPASTNGALIRVHAFVSGRVQGVGFRAFTRQNAVSLKLTGWVKNLKDGRVECVAEGSAAEVGKLMQALAKGPASARVDRVERKEEPPTGEFQGFEVTE